MNKYTYACYAVVIGISLMSLETIAQIRIQILDGTGFSTKLTIWNKQASGEIQMKGVVWNEYPKYLRSVSATYSGWSTNSMGKRLMKGIHYTIAVDEKNPTKYMLEMQRLGIPVLMVQGVEKPHDVFWLDNDLRGSPIRPNPGREPFKRSIIAKELPLVVRGAITNDTATIASSPPSDETSNMIHLSGIVLADNCNILDSWLFSTNAKSKPTDMVMFRKHLKEPIRTGDGSAVPTPIWLFRIQKDFTLKLEE